MRNKIITRDFYVNHFGFEVVGDFDGYLLIQKDSVEIHFFEFPELDPLVNYSQVYIRVEEIDFLYQRLIDSRTLIHPNGKLEAKPWGQREFVVLDPDNNLLTFGAKW